MIRIDFIWLALGASDLRGGIDKLLALVVHGFALGAQAHNAYVFAHQLAQLDEGAHHVHRNLDRPGCVEHRGRHDGAVLGERQRQLAPTAPT